MQIVLHGCQILFSRKNKINISKWKFYLACKVLKRIESFYANYVSHRAKGF